MDLARYIDHTLLKPEAQFDQIKRLVDEAVEYNFASVCINPVWVKKARELLKDNTSVKICTVIGFPLGANTTETKVFEARQALEDGATEIDMVINIGGLKGHQADLVLEDIKKVVEVAKGKALTKVILETGLLTEEEKIRGCRLAKEAGIDFVKTSTGFLGGGATVEDIALMRKTVGPELGVKASGGVRNYQDAIKMIEAGATRIGTSSGVDIIKGKTGAESY